MKGHQPETLFKNNSTLFETCLFLFFLYFISILICETSVTHLLKLDHTLMCYQMRSDFMLFDFHHVMKNYNFQIWQSLVVKELINI